MNISFLEKNIIYAYIIIKKLTEKNTVYFRWSNL